VTDFIGTNEQFLEHRAISQKRQTNTTARRLTCANQSPDSHGRLYGKQQIRQRAQPPTKTKLAKSVMSKVVNSPRPVILVQCLTCQHHGFISERELVRFGLKPFAPVAQFVKRLRCRKCGGGSVMARPRSKTAVA
jgi:hypothetical protein